ncbi:unnamed protein product [Rotaria sp. Silwood2]|nr:unnamed protein product [Rotaria sp. Silwood2]
MSFKSDDLTSVVNEEANSSPPESQSTSSLSATTSSEIAVSSQTLTPINNDEKYQASLKQRLHYDRHELLSIRDKLSPFPIPENLPLLDIVINRHGDNRPPYTGTSNPRSMNPTFHRQSFSSSRPSSTHKNNPKRSNDSGHKSVTNVFHEPVVGNRVENSNRSEEPNQNVLNHKILHKIILILNDLTPQTYDKLQKKIEELNTDHYEILEGMISIIVSKAADGREFGSLYVRLCENFQKKEVILSSEGGNTITYNFCQILLNCCQKKLENNNKQEIECEQQKAAVDAIGNKRQHKEEADKLDEDLIEAKRRKLRIISFIGDLFSLHMLPDTIVYECIECLLRDKTDEESLEYLCHLLHSIGKELDSKADETPTHKSNLEKYYRKLYTIFQEQKISTHIRSMIHDLINLRQASWTTIHAEAKPTTIYDSHEQERLKLDQERGPQQSRATVINSTYSKDNRLQYNDGCGSRDSRIKQQSNRHEEDKVENHFNVNSVRQLQSNDKQNQRSFSMRLSPQYTWRKGSDIEKRLEEDRSLTERTEKSPVGSIQQLKSEIPLNVSFNKEKIEAHVHSLIKEYTENYSESTDQPVKKVLEDLSAFRTARIDQQVMFVRELFTNGLQAKQDDRKAVGRLLDAALNRGILFTNTFLSGFKLIVDAAPDYVIGIPLIWQYISEVIGAFIAASTSNMALLKSILDCVPDNKSKQLFQCIIRYATEFSSQSHIQKCWQSSVSSSNDLIKPYLTDPSFLHELDWLFDTSESKSSTSQSKETNSPHADPQLVKLFKSFNDQNTTVTDPKIITYIREHMDPNEKFYIRNIVLSYLEACLINRGTQKKIQEDIAKKRMTVLNAIIEHKPEAEIQAVYAIQNFVNKLEHPPRIARLLFDIFYDEECVSEYAFFEWLQHPDQSETEGHAVVEKSTEDFFYLVTTS